MTFFDWFMAIVGVVNVAALIFWLVCRLIPTVLENKTIKEVYYFFEGIDDYVEEECEIV